MTGRARGTRLHAAPFAAGHELAAHADQVMGVAVGEVQAEGLRGRRPLPRPSQRAVGDWTLSHSLKREVARVQPPRTVRRLAGLGLRQQVGVVDAVLGGEV